MAASTFANASTRSTTKTRLLREYLRVRAASGVVAMTTVPAKTVTRRPAVEMLTPSSLAMSGRSPVGRNSLVTETKMAPASVSRPIQGNGASVGVGAVVGEDTGVADRDQGRGQRMRARLRCAARDSPS